MTVLVDTCIATDKTAGGRRPSHAPPAFLDDCAMAGGPGDGGSWDMHATCTSIKSEVETPDSPTAVGANLPRSRYLFARREWEHWTSRRRTAPSASWPTARPGAGTLGLAELVEMTTESSDGIGTSRHTGTPNGKWRSTSALDGRRRGDPGEPHATTRPRSRKPAWQKRVRHRSGPAREETRRAFLRPLRGSGRSSSRLLGTHFHNPNAGRIVQHETAWSFAVGEPRCKRDATLDSGGARTNRRCQVQSMPPTQGMRQSGPRSTRYIKRMRRGRLGGPRAAIRQRPPRPDRRPVRRAGGASLLHRGNPTALTAGPGPERPSARGGKHHRWWSEHRRGARARCAGTGGSTR